MSDTEPDLRALLEAATPGPWAAWAVMGAPSQEDAALIAALRNEAAALLDDRDRLEDERGARQIAGEAADRFRDVLSECLGHDDENPGDDALVAELRDHFGKSGPEPRRWRDFCTSALAVVDQINATRPYNEPT